MNSNYNQSEQVEEVKVENRLQSIDYIKSQYAQYNSQNNNYKADQYLNVEMVNVNQSSYPQNAHLSNQSIIVADANPQEQIKGQGNDSHNNQERPKTGCLACIPAIAGGDQLQIHIVRVYSLLTIKAIFITMICCMTYSLVDMESWFEDYFWFFFIPFGIYIAAIAVILCFAKLIKIFPFDIITFCCYSVLEAFMVSSLSAFTSGEMIFYVSIIGSVMYGTIAIVSMFFKKKLHWAIMILVIFILVVAGSSILFAFFSDIWYVPFLGFFVLLLAGIITYVDIDNINGRFGLTFDDYIAGSLVLYQEVALVIIIVLVSAGKGRENRSGSNSRHRSHYGRFRRRY